MEGILVFMLIAAVFLFAPRLEVLRDLRPAVPAITTTQQWARLGLAILWYIFLNGFAHLWSGNFMLTLFFSFVLAHIMAVSLPERLKARF